MTTFPAGAIVGNDRRERIRVKGFDVVLDYAKVEVRHNARDEFGDFAVA